MTNRDCSPARRDGAPRSLGVLTLAALLLAAGCELAPVEEPSAASSRPLVVRNGTLVDGTGGAPVEDAVVVVRGDSVAAVGAAGQVQAPSGARVVDAGGGWITPGLIDAHVHFSQTGWFDGRPDAADVRDRHPYPEVVAGLRAGPDRFYGAYLCSGVTGVFDVGGYPWTRDLQRRGEDQPGAVRVAAAGALLSTVDFWLNLPDQRQFVHMADETTVRETVRSHAALGSAAIKVWYIMPPEPPDTARIQRLVRAAASQADSAGLPLIVHATGLWEAKDAVRAGASVLVHSVWDDEVDEEFLRLAREAGVVYVPTLTVTEGYGNAYAGKTAEEMPYPDRCLDDRTRELYRTGLPEEQRPSWARGDDVEMPPNPSLERGIENLRRVHEAGIAVALGTDAGNPGTAHGPSVHREAELMAQAGMSPTEVLVAATRNGARAMGRGDDLGAVEQGKKADLVVLGADPTADVANLREVRSVVKGGQVVWRRGDEAEREAGTVEQAGPPGPDADEGR